MISKKNVWNMFCLIPIAVLCLSCDDGYYNRGEGIVEKVGKKMIMRDSRDGKVYRIVEIGDQLWMAENLNYKMKGSVCDHDNAARCNTFGRLYLWESAKKACPGGWHLPSKSEFNTLFRVTGKSRKNLASSSGWPTLPYCKSHHCFPSLTVYDFCTCKNPVKRTLGGNDKFGFSILPSGSCERDEKGTVGCYGSYSSYFWTSSAHESTNENIPKSGFALALESDPTFEEELRPLYCHECCPPAACGNEFYFSVRCLRD